LPGSLLRHRRDAKSQAHPSVFAEWAQFRAPRWTAWLASDADVVAYMDVDLSTGLAALRDLIEPLLAGRADVAIGSRLVPSAHVTRSFKRECISRGYNLLLRTALHLRVRDAQCGFKAVRAGVARELLPAIRDEGWFFDTELLVLAQRSRLRTVETPVVWIEDRDSRVRIASTAITDLRGVARMMRTQPGAFSLQRGDHHISVI
jgi:hypothetical protein